MKTLISLTVFLGLGLPLTAQEPIPLPQIPQQEQVVPPGLLPQPSPLPQPYTIPAPVPFPIKTVMAAPAPTFRTKHQARKYQRDFERHLEKVFGQQFGSCVRCLDVDVDVFSCTVCISGKAKNPFVCAQIQQFASLMPELAGYQVRLQVKA